MIFLVFTALWALAISFTGFMMLALPETYVRIGRWYLSKVHLRNPDWPQRYLRWSYRLSGFALFLLSLAVWLILWIELKNYLK